MKKNCFLPLYLVKPGLDPVERLEPLEGRLGVLGQLLDRDQVLVRSKGFGLQGRHVNLLVTLLLLPV